MTLALRYGARSDVGLLRDGNEDAMYAGPRLLAVADGMGGHAAGEVASRIAIETVAGLDLDPPGSDLLTAMRDAVESANGYLRDMVSADTALEGMGTTLTALLWAGQRLGLVHVGDSRAYLFRDGALQQITHDHTLVQSLVDEGRITPEEATTHPQRSWITRALDGRGDIELDLSVREARPGDRYLLCTDGLSGVVSEDTICEALMLPGPQEACDRLVELALRAGGPDNVTCIVADIVDDAAADGDAPIVGGSAAEHRPPARVDDTPAARAAVIHHRGRHKHKGEGEPQAADAGTRGGDTDGSSRRVAYLLIGVAVVIVAGVVASWLYVRTQYYVGVAHGPASTVAVYRGVSGDVLGVDLSHVDQRTDIPVSALPSAYQSQVQAGIDARSAADARRIISNLREQACPLPTPTLTPRTALKTKPAPVPTPPYCRATP